MRWNVVRAEGNSDVTVVDVRDDPTLVRGRRRKPGFSSCFFPGLDEKALGCGSDCRIRNARDLLGRRPAVRRSKWLGDRSRLFAGGP